jgi:hypothetical protein
MSRPTRMLSGHDIVRLEVFRRARRMDIVQLKMAMADAPFTWPTLLRAMCGKPIEEANYRFIVAFLNRHCPDKVVPDGKAAAAGDSSSDEAVPCSK